MDSIKKGFMYKLAKSIVKFRKAIIIVFIALMVFSVFSSGWTQLENNLTDYLPDDAEAKKGFDIINSELIFMGNIRVMVEDISKDEALKISDDISAFEGIYKVTFDAESQDYYHDNKAMFEISFTDRGMSETGRKATEQILAYLEPYQYYEYANFIDVDAFLGPEMIVVGIVVAIVVIATLIITSTTYADVLVLVSTFFAAALINAGTNFLLGKISTISNTITFVMQLALSVDYAIILCNRYDEEREKLPAKEAVIVALTKSIPAIAASSLTTIAGLAAMTFMQFHLGADMGIVLIKSIIVALITVFTFMPAMLMLCSNLLDKTKHKSFIPKISFLGKFAYSRRLIITVLFVVIIIIGYIGNSLVKYEYTGDLMKHFHQSEMDIARTHIEKEFGSNNMSVMILPAGDYEKEMALSDDLKKCKEVKSLLGLADFKVAEEYQLGSKVTYKDIVKIAEIDEVSAQGIMAMAAADRNEQEIANQDIEEYSVPLLDLFDSLYKVSQDGSYEISTEQRAMIEDYHNQLAIAKKQLQSDKHSCIVVYLDLPKQSDETFAFFEKMHSIAEKYYDGDQVLLSGDSVGAKDFSETFKTDSITVSILSVIFVMVILMFSFKSVGMPLLLILIIQGSIWINFAIPAITGDYVFFMCTLIVSSIQMGANIDYAIVVSSRYIELRNQNVYRRKAIIEALNHGFPTVVTSGTIMIVAGLAIGLMVSTGIIAGMGKFVGIGTAISLVLINLALPAILVIGDKFVRASTLQITTGMENKSKKIARRILANVICILSVIALVLTPITAQSISSDISLSKQTISDYIEKIVELKTINNELKASDEKYGDIGTEFAEHLLTDKIGQEEIDFYKKQLEEGEEQYRAGYEKYLKGKKEYEDGKAKYEAGKAEYDAGLIKYEEGKKALEEGQAQYDAGMLEYEEGQRKLEEGEEEFAQVEPLYNAALLVKQEYDEALANYEKSVEERGELSLVTIALKTVVDAQRIAFEATGLTSLYERLESAKAEIEEGKVQLAEAELQLAEAKVQLDAGKAEIAEAELQLPEAKRQLEEAYEQLEAGKAELDEGWAELEKARAELDDAAAQIDDGEQTLEHNKKQLDMDFSALDAINDKKEKLNAATDMFMSYPEIAKVVGTDPSTDLVCNAAARYFNEQWDEYSNAEKTLPVAEVLCMWAALCTLLFWLLEVCKNLFFNKHLSLGLGLAAVVFAALGAGFWNGFMSDYGNIIFFIVIAICIAQAVEMYLRYRIKDKVE